MGSCSPPDPANAITHADLAFADHFIAVFGWSNDPAQTFARSGEAARRAAALDDVSNRFRARRGYLSRAREPRRECQRP
jgi:hypothetical protein